MPLINSISELNQPIDIMAVTRKMVNGVVVSTFEPGGENIEMVFSTWAKVLTNQLFNYKVAAGNWNADETAFVIRHEQPGTILTSNYLTWNGQTYKIDTINYDNAKGEWDVIIAKRIV
jgi:hypothetical protein